MFFFFFQAEDGIRDYKVTGVQTCALPICYPDGSECSRRFRPLRRKMVTVAFRGNTKRTDDWVGGYYDSENSNERGLSPKSERRCLNQLDSSGTQAQTPKRLGHGCFRSW